MNELKMGGGALTDKDAFKSCLQQSFRNIPFFAVGAYVVAFLTDLFGFVGLIIAAVAAVVFLLLALEALIVGVLLGGVLVVGTQLLSMFFAFFTRNQPPPETAVQPQWAILSMVVRMVDGAVYSACLYGIGKTANWWGFG